MPHRPPAVLMALLATLAAAPANATEPVTPAPTDPTPALPLPAAPRPIACADHGEVVDALTGQYDERRVSIGLQTNGDLLEVFASGRTGTWTILSTRTDGVSCIVAVGRHFAQKPVEGAADRVTAQPDAPGRES